MVRNRYRVIERLGQGGGGSVYAVADQRIGPAREQRRALKALFFDNADDRGLLDLLRQEFRVLARLSHPRLARVYDFGRLPADNGLEGSRGRPGYFFTRDLIDGDDMQRACRGADLVKICTIALQTARLLDVLHAAGMVHGDFKPANVIVDAERGEPHLIDFGLVRGEGTSMFSGTAAYLPPEVVAGKQVDRRTDLYSFGIALYQLIVGSLPLPQASLGELVSWHLHGEPLSLAAQREVPPALDALVRRLTERDPDHRYPSAGELAAALGRVLGELGADTPTAEASFVAPAAGSRFSAPLSQLEVLAAKRLGARIPGKPLPPVAVVVHGEAGAGKSALLRELSWRCQLGGYEVLRAGFHEGDARAYGPLTELLDQVSALSGVPHPLESVASWHAPADPGAEHADRYAIYQRIADYLLEASVALPLLLIFEEVEQADAESRAALRFLAHTLDREASLLLIIAHDSEQRLEEILAQLPHIELARLDVGEVERMLEAASQRADSALARAIHEHSGGNPQFVFDILRSLWTAGWPTHPDLAALAPPASLEEQLTMRWGRCTSAEQQVLATLAVAGRGLSGLELFELLEIAALADDMAVGLPFEQLEAQGWLTRRSDGSWGFRNGAAAHTVRGLAAVEVRQALHRALFQRLLQAGDSEKGDTHTVERARHGLAAGELERAWPDVERALEQLRGLGAFRRAIALAEAALELLPDVDAQSQALRLSIGEMLVRAGDHEAAIQSLTALSAGSGEFATTARLELARAQRLAGRPSEALATLSWLADAVADPLLQIRVLAAAAAAQAVLDDHDGVLRTVEEAAALATTAPRDGALEAELLGRSAWSLGYQQRHEEAEEAFRAALERARTAGAKRVEADILNRWAVVSWRRGNYAGVEQRCSDALSILTASGEIERAAVVRFNLGGYQLQRGLLASALSHFEGSLRLFEGMGTRQNAASARCNLGQLQLQLGLYEQAHDTLLRAQVEMRESGRKSGEALAELLLALVAARRGEVDNARAGVARARAAFLEIGQKQDAADALLDLAEIELEGGVAEAAQAAVEQAGREIELAAVGDLQVRALTLRARVLARSGSRAFSPARALLEEAFEHLAAVDSLQVRWTCHAAEMELMLASGKRADAARAAFAGTEILEQMATGLAPEILTAFWAEPRRRAARQLAAQHALQPSARPGAPPDAGIGVEATMLAATLPPEQSGRLTEERFYRLLEIYRQINSELDPERLLGLVMDTAVELTGAERGFLLLGESNDELRVQVTRNIDPDGETSAYSRSIAERVINSGEPVITVSAHNDPRFVDYASVHLLRLESVLCIPVHARGRVAGVLYMESRFTTGRFTPADQRLLLAFGDQVAIALENARLYADNVKKTRELELANAEIEALAEERGRLLSERTAQLEEARLDLAETRRHLQTRTGRFGLVGASQAMDRLFELVERVSGTSVPVLIEGESGTGKEIVARAIHNNSARAKRRMVSVNCAAIPENLLESELFGHVRGAFTGADREKKGLFAVADGGSLFLDEIGDMPQRMQVDMLRALQEQTIRPVGGQKDIKVDVRVIAASNKPLKELVRQGVFREDLFYRLHVIRLDLPPLRERSDDIPLLVDHFLGRIAEQMDTPRRKVTRRALKRLMEYRWPGNVRQLEHALVNAVVLAESDVLDFEDFNLESPRDLAPLPSGKPAPPPSAADREVAEKQRILAALEEHGWNKSLAAKALGIPRRTFYRRLTAYNIQ